MNFFLSALFRFYQQWSHERRWRCIDMPARIEEGAGPDGHFPKERAEADKERLPPSHSEYKAPDQHTPFQAKLRRRWGR